MEQYMKGIIVPKVVDDNISKYFDDDKEECVKKNCCEYCGSEQEDFDLEEEVVCTKCGTLFEPNIDSSAEYRFFGAEDRSSTDPVGHSAAQQSRRVGSRCPGTFG